jgi:hypothetical protein
MRRIILILFLIFPFQYVLSDEKKDLLELSYQSFVYTKDLENAYKLSKKAVSIYPESIDWQQRLFQICVWTGRMDEAMDILEKIYKKFGKIFFMDNYIQILKSKKPEIYENLMIDKIKKGDEKAFKELLDYYINNGIFKKANEIINIYKGNINDKEEYYLLSKFYFYQGEIEKSLYYYEKTDKKDRCNYYRNISEVYFSKKEFDKAKEMLSQNLSYCYKDENYFYFLNDLYFITSDYENLIKNTEKGYKNGIFREIDAERLYLYYSKIDKNYSAKISIDAYKKFKKDYFLYYFSALNIKPDFEIKDLPKDIEYLVEISDFKNLSLKKRKEILDYSLKNKDKFFLNQYLWKVLEYGSGFEKDFLIKNLKCSVIEDETLLAVSYLNLDRGNNDDALYCFEKMFKKNPDAKFYFSYSEFLENSGFKTEAEYYRYIAYKYFKNKNDLDEDERKQLLSLSIEFEDDRNFKEKLSKLNNKDLLELSILHLSKYQMYDNIKSLIEKSKNAPLWASFMIINYEKNAEEFQKIKNENIPIRDKTSFLDFFRKRDEVLDESYKMISHSLNDFENKKLSRYIYEKYIPKNSFELNYENRNFAESFNIALNFEKYLDKNIFYGFCGNTQKINYLNHTNFLKENDKFNSFYLNLRSYDWNLKFKFNNRAKNFYSITFDKNYDFKNLSFYNKLGFRDISSDTFLLETYGYENYFNPIIRYKIGRSYIENSTQFKEYFDQSDKYCGNGIINETSYLSFYKDFSIRPYYKFGSFNQSPDKNYLFYKIWTYKPSRIIPENFNETGINFSFPGFDKRFSFPLEVSFFYNSVTYGGYRVYGGFKAKRIYKIDLNVFLEYSSSSSTNNDNIFNLKIKGSF